MKIDEEKNKKENLFRQIALRSMLNNMALMHVTYLRPPTVEEVKEMKTNEPFDK